MKKQFAIILGAGLMSLLIGAFVGSKITPVDNSDSEYASTANWASSAITVADEVAEADLIVRAQVIDVNQARKLRQVAPRYTFNGKVDDQGVSIMPFTDSEMAVLGRYKGSSEQSIVVMQTGGSLAASNGDPSVKIISGDDPIFVVGGEYVLFLKDISGDPVHGQGRKIYRIVNPAGRYDIQGTKVFSHSEFPRSFTPPATLDDLVHQIKQAL